MMTISSYHQYYIRQLLRKSAKQLGYPTSGIGIYQCLQTELDRLLNHLYPSSDELSAKISELDRLTRLHQKGIEDFRLEPADLIKIEQKIFWLLGLKFLAVIAAMQFNVVPESSTTLFHFFLDQQMQQGIRYADELYGKVLEFGTEYDLQVCRLLFSLRGQKVPFLLTVSEHQHRVWVDLRSPAYRTLLRQEGVLLGQVS